MVMFVDHNSLKVEMSSTRPLWKDSCMYSPLEIAQERLVCIIVLALGVRAMSVLSIDQTN